jgi:hypothetical protein
MNNTGSENGSENGIENENGEGMSASLVIIISSIKAAEHTSNQFKRVTMLNNH